MKNINNENQLFKDFLIGLWKENNVFRILIGMCPTLAITTLAINGIFMGGATLFVLITSGLTISIIRNLIPSKVRMPVFVIIIATYVTVTDYFLAANFPTIHKVLGIFLPLIIVNCLIMARIEAFSSKMPIGRSFFDALGFGIGFTWALVLLGGVREILGFGTFLGYQVMPNSFQPILVMRLPTGAFITLGLLIALMNIIVNYRKKN